jgi:hypothetical protein
LTFLTVRPEAGGDMTQDFFLFSAYCVFWIFLWVLWCFFAMARMLGFDLLDFLLFF